MKGNPARPGGSLASRPAWSDTFGVFHHAGFFLSENVANEYVKVIELRTAAGLLPTITGPRLRAYRKEQAT
jgi:hypothetical protein